MDEIHYSQYHNMISRMMCILSYHYEIALYSWYHIRSPEMKWLLNANPMHSFSLSFTLISTLWPSTQHWWYPNKSSPKKQQKMSFKTKTKKPPHIHLWNLIWGYFFSCFPKPALSWNLEESWNSWNPEILMQIWTEQKMTYSQMVLLFVKCFPNILDDGSQKVWKSF